VGAKNATFSCRFAIWRYLSMRCLAEVKPAKSLVVEAKNSRHQHAIFLYRIMAILNFEEDDICFAF
jgi:hypothetical protein